jgi:hypothetical protein
LGLGTPRREQAQRRGGDGGTGELHRLTPRDGSSLQTGSQVVEGVDASFFSLHQQRYLLSPAPLRDNASKIIATLAVKIYPEIKRSP